MSAFIKGFGQLRTPASGRSATYNRIAALAPESPRDESVNASAVGLSTSTTTASSGRVQWVDCFKGLCIVLVVYGHVAGGLAAGGLIEKSSCFMSSRCWVYLFHMPAFFFAAGLFAARAQGRSLLEFLRSRLTTLVYPYVVWTALVAVSHMFLTRFCNSPFDRERLWRCLYEPYGYGLWFIYALLLISLCYRVLASVSRDPIFILFVAALLGWLASKDAFDFWPIFNIAMRFFSYYVLGSVLSAWLLCSKDTDKGMILLAVGLGFLGVMTALYGLMPSGPGLTVVLAMFGIIGMVALARGMVALRIESFCSLLGAYSMEIYLGHILLSTLPRPVLKAVGVDQPWIYIACAMIVGLGGSLLLGVTCRRFDFPYLFRWPLRQPSVTH
ncbi:MAG: acyltransferase [Verrucomicrobia bacterium]|nr:acyltransferase [Verrucomicrobiota bacterium]